MGERDKKKTVGVFQSTLKFQSLRCHVTITLNHINIPEEVGGSSC